MIAADYGPVVRWMRAVVGMFLALMKLLGV